MAAQNRARVLLIDDDQDMRWAMRNVLAGAGFDVEEAQGGQPGLELAGQQSPDAVVLDICMPGMGGEEVLRRLLDRDRHLPVVIATAYASIAGAVGAMREGAFEYITKPFRNELFVQSVKRAVSRRQTLCAAPASNVRAAIFSMMGQSPAIQKLVDEIETVVCSEYSVVIQGESGSGKEIVARCLHKYSRRAARPLVIVDCGAVAESLLSSEFFGHEKGAFTGAGDRHRGWFEAAANGGTIFLDEVGNLVESGQKALLRTLEDRTIRRIGSTEPINLDLRVLAATNEDLKARARAGVFREDLYYRLTEYVITVPPLRSRREDIPFLARRFFADARESLGRPLAEIGPDALDMLCAYSWPGNARELRNVMRRIALVSSDILSAARVSGLIGRTEAPPPQIEDLNDSPSLRDRVRCQVRTVERDAILAALSHAKGNKAEAARLLGIDYKTYRTKLKLLERPAEGDGP
ncbi:sigma-54-dependent transcriptional regulator [Methylocystis bryophila]|uniref:DNA-binding transcriptional regulator NtrC n=1 Tax=Methylocystis bryophila TaxID=655015 RepID=A0A1W6MY22_9HYPH|nr:sigma-54 dependent transcriptional regulator [Methylocystis bryophila]ARN82439.1 hypothetical protein B1812_16635 [Methylocystis bryophila]BDV38623.1 DNA-binding response regulator [Methylocystis bryophila]